MRVLYVSYNGLTEPLGRRQVVPYLMTLARRGSSYTVLSFEKRETADAAAMAQVEERLRQAGIEWVPLRYHRRPNVPATSFDMLTGLLVGIRRTRGFNLLHARSTVPAAMVRALAAWRRIPWIYDVRGLIAEEYADAGHWRTDGWLYRLTHLVERWLLRQADGVVFLTDAIASRMREDAVLRPNTPVAVIPCAVDLDEFRPSPVDRRAIRDRLGLGKAPVLIYSGSLGSWYAGDEMMRFTALAREELPGLRLLVLTRETDEARRHVRSYGLEDVAGILSLRPEEVPQHLAAADVGLCFLKRQSSKVASSPTKYGEYLASGLAIVTDSWTGDAARFAAEPAWITIERFGDEDYRRSARRLKQLLSEPLSTREAARGLAVRHFSLEQAADRYHALYARLLEGAS